MYHLAKKEYYPRICNPFFLSSSAFHKLTLGIRKGSNVLPRQLKVQSGPPTPVVGTPTTTPPPIPARPSGRPPAPIQRTSYCTSLPARKKTESESISEDSEVTGGEVAIVEDEDDTSCEVDEAPAFDADDVQDEDDDDEEEEEEDDDDTEDEEVESDSESNHNEEDEDASPFSIPTTEAGRRVWLKSLIETWQNETGKSLLQDLQSLQQ